MKTELTYSKVEHLLSQYYEDQLSKEVSKIFQEMEYRVINNLAEYYNPEVMFKAHTDLILAPIHEMHKDYYELLCKYKIREFDKSRASGKRIVERLINFRRRGNIISNQYTVLKADLDDRISSTITKDKLFGTSPDVHENIETRTYQLSEKTLSRVDSQINDIIVNGYEEGMGIDKVSRDIRRRFGQLKTWESRRIARTEIHNSQCLGVIKGYNDMGVEYIQWSTARDSRVRGQRPKDSADHIHMEGEIIRMGGVFSNGLMYPGDMNGPAAEIINCRCQALPFIMPYDCIAPPGMDIFRESDIVHVDTPTIEEVIRDASVTTSFAETEQQSQINLKKTLSEICDTDKESELISDVLTTFRKQAEGLDHEIMTVIDNEFNITNIANGGKATVEYPLDTIIKGRKEGLLMSVHNHPNKSLQMSISDVHSGTVLKEKYKFTYVDGGDLLLLKNKNVDNLYYKHIYAEDIEKKYVQFRKDNLRQFNKKYKRKHDSLLKKYKKGKISKEEMQSEWGDLYSNYCMEQLDKNIIKLNKLLEEEGVEFIRISMG